MKPESRNGKWGRSGNEQREEAPCLPPQYLVKLVQEGLVPLEAARYITLWLSGQGKDRGWLISQCGRPHFVRQLPKASLLFAGNTLVLFYGSKLVHDMS